MAIPKCPYFGKCGGCASQDVDYSEQLARKKRLLITATRLNDVQVFSGPEYSYRNRMDFVFHKNGLGLRKQGSWFDVVDVEGCVISEPHINLILSEVREQFKNVDVFDQEKKRGTYRYAVIRTASESSSLTFVMNSESPELLSEIEKIQVWAVKSSADNVLVAKVRPTRDDSISDNLVVLKGSEFLVQNYLGKNFIFSSQGFFQNNHIMAQKMQAYVHNILRKYELETRDCQLLDLYSGVGTFGIVNSGLFKSVLLVESWQQCVDSARKNIAENRILNAESIYLDAKQIKQLNLSGKFFAIVDPPRAGMDDEAILELNKKKPSVIIYISCNLQQLSKDLQKFQGYKINSAAMFDLFPQTQHCEGVVELVRIQ